MAQDTSPERKPEPVVPSWTAEGHQCASFGKSAFGNGSGVQHERSENEACGGLRSGVAVSASISTRTSVENMSIL
jgi:hypothetical protein